MGLLPALRWQQVIQGPHGVSQRLGLRAVGIRQ